MNVKNTATIRIMATSALIMMFIVINTANAASKLMSQPTVSAEHIAFIYAEDLWVANLDGSDPIRLTIDAGVESSPQFSPDGSQIAFNAHYDGNDDVYIVAVKGGVPKRLTYHPYFDSVVDFNADGSEVLFVSRRFSHTNRFAQLHTVSVNGGPATELPIPTAFDASYSDDDKYIAYNPNGSVFSQWKNYRGGTQAKIWLYDRASHDVEVIAKPASGANDSNPQWSGD